jgi:hypothetical protein
MWITCEVPYWHFSKGSHLQTITPFLVISLFPSYLSLREALKVEQTACWMSPSWPIILSALKEHLKCFKRVCLIYNELERCSLTLPEQNLLYLHPRKLYSALFLKMLIARLVRNKRFGSLPAAFISECGALIWPPLTTPRHISLPSCSS